MWVLQCDETKKSPCLILRLLQFGLSAMIFSLENNLALIYDGGDLEAAPHSQVLKSCPHLKCHIYINSEQLGYAKVLCS